MKKKIVIGVGFVLVMGLLFFLAYRETSISREFCTTEDSRPIRW